MRWLVLCITLAILFSPISAKAQCTLVSNGETRPEGRMIYNADYDVHQICLDGQWKAVEPIGCAAGDGCDPCTSGPVGTRCISDGAIYAGTTVGGVRMYAAACDHGMTWDGTNCTGSQISSQWKTSNTTTSGTSSTTDGLTNTDAMAAAGLADHSAAEACRNAGSEWYLPAQDELDTIWSNLVNGAPDSSPNNDITDDFFFDISGSLPAGYYWSSSEITSTSARIQRFSDGNTTFTNDKDYAHSVRCVRRGS